jgi:hypothetical protein
LKRNKTRKNSLEFLKGDKQAAEMAEFFDVITSFNFPCYTALFVV